MIRQEDLTEHVRQLRQLRTQLQGLEGLRGVLGEAGVEQAAAPLRASIAELEAQIQTGGSLVAGDVTVEGGDFVGQDQTLLTAEGERAVVIGGDARGVLVVTGDGAHVYRAPEDVPPEALLQGYLRALADECSHLPLGVIDPRFLQVGSKTRMALPDVYVDLDVLAVPRDELDKGAFWEQLARGEGQGRTALLEALAHPRITRFVLLGDPGSGKTTFVNYITYALARGLPVAAPWQGLLPIRLILRDVGARCIPQGATRGEAGMLWAALRVDLAVRLGEEAAAVLFSHLQRRLLAQGGLLLLDGLDEVPEANRRRGCLLEAVADLAGQLAEHSRFLVTARPYAYADPRWRLPGFETLTLAPFDQAQSERFVARWHEAVRPAMGWDEVTAHGKGMQLLEALAARPYLGDLATRPLLLTLMATLHTGWGQLPEDRADLYEETTKLLLHRWQRGREVRASDGQVMIEPGIARALAVEDDVVRTALHRLAYDVHERQGQSVEREVRPADVSEGEVWAAFAPLLPEDFNPRVLLRYLETRTGLLIARSPGVYAFPHRSFQEYLAACRLAERSDFARELGRRVRQDPTWWREVYLLGVGKAKQGGLGNAVNVVNTLLPEGPGDVLVKTGSHWQAALLAGHALLDLRFPDKAGGESYFEVVLRRVRRWLVEAMRADGVLGARERVDAGQILGRLGDPRFREDAFYLPDEPLLGFVEVGAGSFTMGSERYDEEKPAHPVDLPTFYLARYPVTVAQFRAFVQDSGHKLADADSLRGVDNHPVVLVTWDEALAYCRWLTETLRAWGGTSEPLANLLREQGWVVTLPSEAEWEKAARGMDGREFPWGDEPGLERANYYDTGIGRTSAVGCFPSGVSPHGLEELSGNVWEWTRSRWGRTYGQSDFGYPYEPGDGREDLASRDMRVLRGGSFHSNVYSFRCAARLQGNPCHLRSDVGFRCCVASPCSPGAAKLR